MVEKQIEFSLFKTSTPELDCGCSRKLKFTQHERSSIMNYRNKKASKSNTTAPAQRELTVATLVDLFYLKEEVDQAYAEHVRTLEVVFTTYRHPANAMLIDDELIPEITQLIESRGYDLFKDEVLLGRLNRRISRLSFTAQVGMFPNWALPAKED